MVLLLKESKRKYSSAQREITRWFGALVVIGTGIFLLLVLLNGDVSIADRKSAQNHSVKNPQSVSTAEKDIKVPHQLVRSLETFLKRGTCTKFFHNSKPVNMKILFLNCQSFNTAKYDISCICNRLEVDILCLNETWEKP